MIETKEARFTVFTKNMVRMEYSPSGVFEDRASRVFVNRFLDRPAFTVSNDTASSVTITTDDLSIEYKGGRFTASSLVIHGNVDGLKFSYMPSGDVNVDNGWSNNLFGTILGLGPCIFWR